MPKAPKKKHEAQLFPRQLGLRWCQW